MRDASRCKGAQPPFSRRARPAAAVSNIWNALRI
jgi:hypothetical protein